MDLVLFNIISWGFFIITLSALPVLFNRRRKQRRLRSRLIATVILPGEERATFLEFWGEAAKSVREMISFEDMVFLLELEDQAERNQLPTEEAKQRYRRILNAAVAAWLETDDGQKWLVENIR